MRAYVVRTALLTAPIILAVIVLALPTPAHHQSTPLLSRMGLRGCLFKRKEIQTNVKKIG